MNLIDTFISPFKFIGYREFNYPVDSFKATYKTNEIYDETTKEEIYILSKMYFNDLVSKYKNYVIDGRTITESGYRLYVDQIVEDEIKYVHIYSMGHNALLDKISIENRYDDNFTIEGSFRIVIDIMGYYVEDYGSDYESDEDVVRTVVSETECVVCLENTPNVIYPDCYHKVACRSCDRKGKFHRCPLCRTKIRKTKIII